MRIATEITEGLQYRLCMLGISIDGSASVFCNNMSVVMNTTRPESTLKKKHIATNSEPNVEDSTVFCFLEYQIIGALLT